MQSKSRWEDPVDLEFVLETNFTEPTPSPSIESIQHDLNGTSKAIYFVLASFIYVHLSKLLP